MEEIKMEENKKAVPEQDENPKQLSYDQLKAYVLQMEAQAKKIYQENIALRQALNSRDTEYALKCLDHADLFSADFIQSVVTRLEEILDPSKEETEQPEKEEEN